MRFAKMLYDDRTRGCVSERDLQAHFEYTCTLTGSQRPAYVPVVASGYDSRCASSTIYSYVLRANSLIIHYVANNHLIQPDEMVLFDGGCEYKFREQSSCTVDAGS
jgi:intermediate cleaving peptidase 55